MGHYMNRLCLKKFGHFILPSVVMRWNTVKVDSNLGPIGNKKKNGKKK